MKKGFSGYAEFLDKMGLTLYTLSSSFSSTKLELQLKAPSIADD